MPSDHIKEYDRRVKTLAGNREKLEIDIKAAGKWLRQIQKALPRMQEIETKLKAVNARAKDEDFSYGQTVGELVKLDLEEEKLKKGGKLDDKAKADLAKRRAKFETLADKQLQKTIVTSKELRKLGERLDKMESVRLER